MTTYRADYAASEEGGDDLVVVYFGQHRAKALAFARRTSAKRQDSVYVIRTEAGVDTGQRVYAHGYLSHQDDVF